MNEIWNDLLEQTWIIVWKDCSEEIFEKVKTIVYKLLTDKKDLEDELNLVSTLPNNNHVAIVDINDEGIINVLWLSDKLEKVIPNGSINKEIVISDLFPYTEKAKKRPWKNIYTNLSIDNERLFLNLLYDEDSEHFNFYFVPSLKHNEYIMDKIKDSLEMVSDIAWLRDPETWEHTQRLALLSSFLAKLLWKDDKFINNIKLVAPLHDIWKVWIPDNILLKNWKLTEDEFEIMKTHTVEWWKAIENLEKVLWKNKILDLTKNVVLYHHEKYDWSWYPEWLKKEEIPIEARILALVDVFDALKSKRPYKEPFSDNITKEIILEWREKHFDPELVDLFLKYYDDMVIIRSSMEDKQ